MKKRTIAAICLFLVAGLLLYDTLTKEDSLIDRINFASDPTKNISQLYMSQKYEPDLYMCLGETVSGDIYAGYIQVKKSGITYRGTESMYFTSNAIFDKQYYCMKKTKEEGQFYFGFVKDPNVKAVNIDGREVEVNSYNYPDSEKKFGFWHLKTDYGYTINNFSLNAASADYSNVDLSA